LASIRDHHEVHPLGEARIVARRHNNLYDEYFASGFYGCPAVAQNGYGIRIPPIVDDMPQQIRVSAAGNGLEEIAAREAAAIRERRPLNCGARTSNDCGKVEEHASHSGVPLQR